MIKKLEEEEEDGDDDDGGGDLSNLLVGSTRQHQITSTRVT